MDYGYDAGAGVILQEPWNITFLSTRDVAIDIPINYVPTPGVSVTAACFSHNRFDDPNTSRCVSNLLAIGFRKLVIDLYWDAPRHTWSLCPVQIPSNNAAPSSPAANATVPSPASTGSLSAVSNAGQGLTSSSIVPRAQNHVVGNTSMSYSIDTNVATITVNIQALPNTTIISFPTTSADNVNEEVFANGPYICSSTVTLDSIIRIVSGFLDSTDDTLEAVLRYLIFNIHAAAPVTDATAPGKAPPPENLPTDTQSLGGIINFNLSRYLYTPGMLAADRADVNRGWRKANNFTAPDAEFYYVLPGTAVSPDGWPSEGYMEFAHARRLLIGYGTIDPQMSNYSEPENTQYLFPQDYVQRDFNVSFSANGTVTDGCIFNPNDRSLAAANSSWAADVSGFTFPTALLGLDYVNITLDRITNITACGVSPLLNSSLDGRTADQDPSLYQAYLNNVIWTWAPGEPRLTPASFYSNDNDDVNTKIFRCAAFSIKDQGRWFVRECSENHYGACRANDAPYVWRLSNDPAHYSELDSLCPDNYTFAVPRTPLENRYLLETSQQAGKNAKDYVWLNFNSLNNDNCWVTGINSTCPYQAHPEDDTKQIVVPTIAAIVILVLTACTLLLKCGSNRRTSRRRRRILDGWEYEGVPS